MNLMSTKIYGRLILAVVVRLGLWAAWDAQAGIYQPGWFTGWRSAVWCRTVLTGAEFESALFFHYSGQRLRHIMDELHVPLRYQALYLHADQQETTCYENWKEAAEGDILFYTAAEEHPEVLKDWTEKHYRQAVLMLHLQPKGLERLQTMVNAQLRLNEQEAQH